MQRQQDDERIAGRLCAGVDEVGRGPLAGPVVAAAVILPAGYVLSGLTDSKRLSARRREALAAALRDEAQSWALGSASAAEIDTLNIHHATLLAMRRALLALPRAPRQVLVDGRFVPEGPWNGTAVVGGDAAVPAISAASVLAKVARDAWLAELHLQYPAYGFDRHAGYPTRAHLAALATHGPCPEHRRSFGPVARQLRLAAGAAGR
ncbi:Ribonuclease HII [Thioalkalivibrio nitratireducens DSM 14787]|uniref:Ribonuclease HII n=1 Tax=Thioalkalivibrio nitratireducens (strain DSM 14787 / UNIQEM 213 / ALEN2) TaxID=1255043 RepID=L0DX61_THIND|nr:ribonuclease HII [Thioalkalivibrio nitratireducens]AGA33555.1 Ribonuclease HII [Thioalkalivibrio nitratireducens DSM 14787]